MSDNDIAAILRRLDDLGSSVETLTQGIGEVKSEVVALKAWQTARDGVEHDAAVRREAYGRLFRWGFLIWKSDIAKFIIAGALAYAGSRTA